VAITNPSRGPQRILWIDPFRKRVLERRAFRGSMLEGVPVPGGYALALAPKTGTGPMRLLIAKADGGTQTIELDGIVGGAPAGGERGRFLKPAFAVDEEGGRLYAIAARGDVAAEVDLATGAVEHHALGASASKGNVDIWLRYAEWAGNGQVLVHGQRWPAPRREGRRPPPPEPFGAALIDTADWSMTTLDARANSAQVVWDVVLAHGHDTGLLAFGLDGDRRFARFRDKRVLALGSSGTLAYVWIWGDRELHVIDVRDGRTVREFDMRLSKRIPSLLVPPA
jgi:hypothetical protein